METALKTPTSEGVCKQAIMVPATAQHRGRLPCPCSLEVFRRHQEPRMQPLGRGRRGPALPGPPSQCIGTSSTCTTSQTGGQHQQKLLASDCNERLLHQRYRFKTTEEQPLGQGCGPSMPTKA